MTTPAESAKAFHESVLSAIAAAGKFEMTENQFGDSDWRLWYEQLDNARSLLYVANDIARRLRAMVEAEG